MHSASDKYSHAFARYALSAAIGTFSSQSSRDPLHGLARAIDARAPPAVPGAGTNPRRRMSSVSPRLSSAGTALRGRAALSFARRPALQRDNPGAMSEMRLKATSFRAAAELSAGREPVPLPELGERCAGAG